MDIIKHIDEVTNIGDKRLQMGGSQPAPKSVKIELTARCNLRCKYCAVGMRKEAPPPDMDLDYFKKITTDMRTSGVEEIGLFYLGEPFMNADLLCKAAEWVKKDLKFHHVFLTSNATLASPDKVKAIMEAGVDSIKWSVNFMNAKQFEEITGKNEKLFYMAINNIQAAWKIKQEGGYTNGLAASSILYGKDKDERKIQKAKQLDELLTTEIIPYVDRHYWLPLYQMDMGVDHVTGEVGHIPTAGNTGRVDDDSLEPSRKALPCWTVFTEGHVRANGSLSACCFGADAKFDMGVLDGNNFMELWNNEQFVALRNAHIKAATEGPDALKGTVCERCVAYE